MEYIKFGVTLIMILLIFWMVDSQKKKQDKEIKKMQENIKVNDKIITYSGLSGIVSKVSEESVILKLNPNDNEVSVEKWAIAGLDDRSIKKESAKK